MPLQAPASPMIGVTPDRFQIGADTLTTPAPFVERVSLSEALSREWPTYAHFTQYDVVGAGFEQWPRLKKTGPVLGQIRAMGGDVLMRVVGLDFDNPGHADWLPGQIDDTLRMLESSPLPLAHQWCAFYTTKRGFRLVYELSEAMPVDRAEPHHRGMVAAFRAAGFDGVDLNCSDWTRLFGLPRVMRDGRMSSQQPYFQMFTIEERLDLATVAPSQKAGTPPGGGGYAYVEIPDVAKPEGDCYGLLYDVDLAGAARPQEWHTAAKRRLRGRRCFPCLFEHAPLAKVGGRDSAIQSLVGEAVGVLFNLPGSSPELIYALFLEPVSQLEPDSGTPDWTDVLWRAVLRYWTAERGKDEWRKAEQSMRVESVQSRTQRMIDGARLWCDDPELHGDDAAATAWLMRHLIAINGRFCWLMRSDGYYDPMAVAVEHLPVRIREIGMEQMLPTTALGDKGKLVVVKPSQLVDRHGTLVREIQGVAGGDGTIIDGVSGERPTLVVRLYRRKTAEELEPTFSPDVDEWLDRLAGEKSKRLKEWIGHALDFEGGPICALSIAGSAGIGKKMIAQGLAECIDTEATADPTTFGAYQGRLKGTPFLLLNEGVSRDVRDLADSFRRYTGGDPLLVNEKYEPLMLVRAPLRVICTTNNLDLVGMLAGQRDLSPDDREAIAVRLMHIDARFSTAPAWLRAKGGLAYTGRAGARWIRSDSGGKSDYILAKHFLWLYVNRPPVEIGARLLMEGRLDDDILQELTVRGGSAPAVVEALCMMIENPARAGKGIAIDTIAGTVRVTNAGLVDFHRANFSQSTGVRLNHVQAAAVMRGLVSAEQGRRIQQIKNVKGNHEAAAWTSEVDLAILLREARRNGYPTGNIERLLATSFRRQNEAAMVPTPIAQSVEAAVAAAPPILPAKPTSLFKR